MRSLSSTRASLGRALLLGGSGSNSAANSASTAAITAAAAAAYSALVPQQQPQSDLPALLAAAARRHFGSGTDYSDGRADSHEFEPRGGAAAVGAGRNKCVMHCDEGFGTASAWRTTQPRLGAWPNAEPGVPRPDVVPAPEPSIFVKETKLSIIGGLTDTDAIEEYDRIKGTADLDDNGSPTAMSGM
ncbi:hypothetical protein CHLRE_03g192150v5 [Chlamydomonas reinhardtii]|uniref:Uncharacterized protein n=1 Tax=Chlamydomonas reinhardtii TaxID=3055 RepID=A0A2K3DYF7_CHLRE|nr:uncharacterized protein CHLRE_03g192150v5 [Chlamydomonas reinhardtii]PNW85555.1 hypothetical protein CHLRE_03g192150v5 [Chlamydomonas reinhardtii]